MQFQIHARRYGELDRVLHAFRLDPSEKGWTLGGAVNSGECDPSGSPYLFQSLDHDSINYPAALGKYLDYLWTEARNRNLAHDEVQAGLTQLADWVSTVEQASPEGVFKGFK